MRVEQRIHTLTAMGRMQGRVLGVMPVVLGLLMFAIDPVLMAAFLRSPVGIMLVGLALVFEIVAALMIRKIVGIDV
jgi:tight adherence protein B